jgi:hypothetical protein
LDALLARRHRQGVTLDAVQDDSHHVLLQGIKARWDRVDRASSSCSKISSA